MNGRQRILTTLDHREPDRVPSDLGASFVTGIHHVAYRKLRASLGLTDEVVIADQRLGLARVDEDVKQRLDVCAGLVGPAGPKPESWKFELHDSGDGYLFYHDEYGIGYRSPKDGGLYFDIFDNPLRGEITVADVEAYPWPDTDDPHRYEGIRAAAERVQRDEQRATVFRGVATGIFQLASWMRGHEQFFMDMLVDPPLANALLEKALEIKLAGWAHIFEVAGDCVDITYDSDDYGTQISMILSPDLWRELIKPRLTRLHEFIHGHSNARVFYHTCGAVKPIIPDLIETGVDILNPVQISAVDMDTADLKREFGRDLTFWGGTIDAQHVLPTGTPAQIKAAVRERMADLMPGGGFVFSSVHNIQADVPGENVLAMWDALREFGGYPASSEFDADSFVAP